MASWSLQRRTIYFLFIVLALALLVGIPVWFFLYEPPQCADGIQNGDEEGIDCGGSCARVCPFQATEPLISWSRFFEVTDGLYTAVALLENPNASVEAFDVPYAFELRDERGLLIARKEGRAYIPPKSQFALFETNIRTDERIPRRVFFTFTGTPEWFRTTELARRFSQESIVLSQDQPSPRLSAVIRNDTVEAARDVGVVAVLYGEDGNAHAASRTVIPRLAPEGSQSVIFTWPEPFDVLITRVEFFTTVVPRR